MENRNPVDKGVIWGTLLVTVGALFLLQSLGLLHFAWKMTIALGFLIGAVLFGAVFARDRRQWWAILPAFALGFIGLMIGLDELVPRFRFEGSLFLGGLGFAFAAIYAATDRRHFWPIIPAGVLLTLATVSGLDTLMPWFDGGAVFFTGLALTFGTVWWESRQQQQWALLVAVACGGLATLILVGSLMRFFFPLALIAVGVFLLLRQQRPGGPQ
ncbi:MAG: hypothetical protein ACOY93_10350 [Bacillota bacterium]